MQDLGLEKEFDDFDIDQLNNELDYLDRYEQETLAMEEKEEEAKGMYSRAFDYDSDENEVSRLDEDIDPEFRDANNQETI